MIFRQYLFFCQNSVDISGVNSHQYNNIHGRYVLQNDACYEYKISKIKGVADEAVETFGFDISNGGHNTKTVVQA